MIPGHERSKDWQCGEEAPIWMTIFKEVFGGQHVGGHVHGRQGEHEHEELEGEKNVLPFRTLESCLVVVVLLLVVVVIVCNEKWF